MRKLRDRLEEGIREKVSGTSLNGHAEVRAPHILNTSFRNVEGEALLLSLDMKGIAVSAGSACTSGAISASHVLTAMGTPPLEIQGSLRFSLGRLNSEEDIDYVLDVLPQVIKSLREISPTFSSNSTPEGKYE
jgi:cysteine desulfurase